MIAFSALRDLYSGMWEIYVTKADGSDSRRVAEAAFDGGFAWSPMGRVWPSSASGSGGTPSSSARPMGAAGVT
jgi:hypothetical protein